MNFGGNFNPQNQNTQEQKQEHLNFMIPPPPMKNDYNDHKISMDQPTGAPTIVIGGVNYGNCGGGGGASVIGADKGTDQEVDEWDVYNQAGRLDTSDFPPLVSPSQLQPHVFYKIIAIRRIRADAVRHRDE